MPKQQVEQQKPESLQEHKMATYKVIQDIEAEDKFLGPLTLKQFIFAAIGVVFSYLSFFVVTSGAWFVALIFAPFGLFGFFMAIPWSKDQPTDLWVLAKIRFRFKPKKRVWNQAGKQDLVTITVPKKVEKVLTKDLSETEVESRLKALADTMNTRGWAIKHAALPTYDDSADRLLSTPIPVGSRLPLDNEAPDILENTKFDRLIDESEKAHKTSLRAKLEQARQGMDSENTEKTPTVAPSVDTEAISEQLKQRREAASLATGKMQKLQPKTFKSKSKPVKQTKPAAEKAEKTEEEKTTSKMTEPSDPDIISLAHNNDLNVATLARQAKNNDDESGEVVVSLH